MAESGEENKLEGEVRGRRSRDGQWAKGHQEKQTTLQPSVERGIRWTIFRLQETDDTQAVCDGRVAKWTSVGWIQDTDCIQSEEWDTGINWHSGKHLPDDTQDKRKTPTQTV
ncbi:hypothetical protein Pmani_011779 [Petrolisthes manimaculis]|uniref:Uncharacterized protein n=1 Tax=Petrolisthes manimaculis TaxID=1843537 RepID=A0AAE1Q0F3_9EUCA|nr:hypothetical protein Pmani_011779 [Petrolisthes manimaculis]